MIANPIIRKEVLSALRTRKAVAIQAVFLLAAAALVWLLWPAGGMQDLGGRQAERLLSVLAIGELLGVTLFAPAFTAASLTLERERNTLDGLFATAMKPWEIAAGKITGALSFLLLLVVCGLPALAAPLLLGGVSGWQVLAVLGVLVWSAIYLGMIGLLVSAMMHRSYRAIIAAYAVLGVVVFLTALPVWPESGKLIARGGPGWQTTVHLIASLSPLEAMMSVVWTDSPYTTPGANLPAYWKTFLPVSFVAVVAIAGAIFAKLRRPIAPARPREHLRVVERGKVTARSFFFLIDPRKRKRVIRWWQNPVLVKEFRTRPMLQGQWLLRAAGICVIASVLLMFLVSLSVQALVAEQSEPRSFFADAATAAAALMSALMMLIGPAIAGGTLCADRETGVWDLLRTTPLSSFTIVSGKLQAAIIPMVLLALATAPALALLIYFEPTIQPNVLRVLWVVGLTILFVAVCGMFFSGVFSRTATATAWTYGVVTAMGLGTMLALLGGDLFSQRVIRAVFMVNPVAAAMAAAGNETMVRYDILTPYVQIIGVATVVLFTVTVLRVIQLRRSG